MQKINLLKVWPQYFRGSLGVWSITQLDADNL